MAPVHLHIKKCTITSRKDCTFLNETQRKSSSAGRRKKEIDPLKIHCIIYFLKFWSGLLVIILCRSTLHLTFVYFLR